MQAPNQAASYAYRPCITLTDNDEPKPAAGYAYTYLVWVCDKPEVLHAPATVSSQLLGVKVRRRHGTNSGQNDYVGLAACRETATGVQVEETVHMCRLEGLLGSVRDVNAQRWEVWG